MKGSQNSARLSPTAWGLIFGHIGNGNLHYNVAMPDDAGTNPDGKSQGSERDLLSPFAGCSIIFAGYRPDDAYKLHCAGMTDIAVRHYQTTEGRIPYRDWIESLADNTVRAAVLARVDRLAFGNFGDWEAVGDGFLSCEFICVPDTACTSRERAERR